MEGTIMQPKTISQGKSGEKFVTDIKTINAEEQKQFCHITANTLPIFLTDEAAQAKGCARRLVPGAMTMSCSIGLMEQAGLLDDVVAFKKEAIARFTADGSLPSRKVRWINTDITRQEDQARLKTLLNDYKGYRKVIMIEGVFFFLNQRQINSVIEFCREILNTGDILLAESFEEHIKKTAVFNRLKTYFEKELHSDGTTTTLPRSFYEELPGFNLKRRNSTLELARELELVPEDMQESEVLNEYCYFLVRE